MPWDEIADLRQQVHEALRGDEFQTAAQRLSGTDLPLVITALFKRQGIKVTLLSVAPAEGAALADYAAVWTTPFAGRYETTWFNIKAARR